MADKLSYVHNQDIAGIIHRVNRYVDELRHSASASVSGVVSHDRARLMSYLQSLAGYIDHIQANPVLDLNESHPREIPINMPDWTTHDQVENESVFDLIRQMETLRFEVANCQSARLASTLIKFDEARCRAMIEKMKTFVENYIDKVQPLDLPESSPMHGMIDPGRTGVSGPTMGGNA